MGSHRSRIHPEEFTPLTLVVLKVYCYEIIHDTWVIRRSLYIVKAEALRAAAAIASPPLNFVLQDFVRRY
ncbi:hypothetical protein QVD17_05950 [Tagetes erecta]|uniref:Uncharacterized protein n=1 Tax=Tagetes erecta TaxID=13708 RepID=A0AAD8LMJ1_TARER|nr:hypothetical protein QVD17_05950 [Tagetes erecta]